MTSSEKIIAITIARECVTICPAHDLRDAKCEFI
jgi:hypothetical protein